MIRIDGGDVKVNGTPEDLATDYGVLTTAVFSVLEPRLGRSLALSLLVGCVYKSLQLFKIKPEELLAAISVVEDVEAEINA